MFGICILLIVFTFKRRQNTKKHMVCHHEFQENEVAYRCLEGFSDVERASVTEVLYIPYHTSSHSQSEYAL